MLAHHQRDRKHAIVMSLTDGTFWCYRCEEYLEAPFYPELKPFYREFYRQKFGERPPQDPVPEAAADAAASVAEACSHCARLSHRGFSGNDPFRAAGCSVCGDASESWVCLGCEKVFCGRFTEGRHAVEHWMNTGTGHSVVMSLKDGTVWCYLCREYQDHGASSALSSFYAAFHMARHGEPPPPRSLMRANSLLSGAGGEASLLAAFDMDEFRWKDTDTQC